jgi:23S rRNA (uracil1939-C5)-methyltransferase
MSDLVLEPSAMVAGGAALARDEDGRVVFVDGALPGERVLARVEDARRDFARARVVEVLRASPDRVGPPCAALATGCGGCTWQHVRPEAQVRFKADIVIDALRRIARLAEPPLLSTQPLTGPALRTTARLGVSTTGRAGHNRRSGASGRRRTGAPRPRSPDVVGTDACLATHASLEELVASGRFPGASEVLLRVGVASGERVVRVSGGGEAVHVPDDVTVVRTGDRRSAFVHEEVAGRRFRISTESFFQPGPVAATGLAEAVTAAAGDALTSGSHLVDLYAGVGLFASVLGAASGARVTAVESEAPAVADAEVNLADLDARIVTSEVGRWRLPPGEAPPDVVVADPARPGLGRPGAAAVVTAGAPRVVLVSCDPASLARDTLLLSAAGYRLATVCLVDAFPHTAHVETVSRFDR